MTKLRCTYQFKSPMEPKDTTPVCRNKATYFRLKLWTPTCPYNGLLFSPSQYCSMFREPLWISSAVNFPLRWDRQETWPTLDFLKVRFRGSPVRCLPHDSVVLLVPLSVHKKTTCGKSIMVYAEM